MAASTGALPCRLPVLGLKVSGCSPPSPDLLQELALEPKTLQEIPLTTYVQVTGGGCHIGGAAHHTTACSVCMAVGEVNKRCQTRPFLSLHTLHFRLSSQAHG